VALFTNGQSPDFSAARLSIETNADRRTVMNINTLLIIIVVVILLGGGGFYFGR
jgi:hypothetical protein